MNKFIFAPRIYHVLNRYHIHTQVNVNTTASPVCASISACIKVNFKKITKNMIRINIEWSSILPARNKNESLLSFSHTFFLLLQIEAIDVTIDANNLFMCFFSSGWIRYHNKTKRTISHGTLFRFSCHLITLRAQTV